MKPEIKKLFILNAPYLLFVYLFDKLGEVVRKIATASSARATSLLFLTHITAPCVRVGIVLCAPSTHISA